MLRKPTNQISIKPRISSQVKFALALAGLCLLMILLVAAFYFGTTFSEYRAGKNRQQLSQLSAELDQRKQELEEAKAISIIAERQQQIQKAAYDELSDAYAKSERKNSYLASRLDFYRSIISPEAGTSGPAIQSLRYTLTDTDLAFDLTLVQSIEHKRQVRGRLRVQLFESETIIEEWPESSDKTVNYQYFQEFSGRFERYSKGEDAKIKVVLTTADGQKIEREFMLNEDKSNSRD